MDDLRRVGSLTETERLGLIELLERLAKDPSLGVLQVVLFGSSARGDRGDDSDVDLLILVESDDWRAHEPVRYLAASLSTRYDVFLSPKVMGVRHFQQVKRAQPLFSQNIRKDGVELFRADDRPGLAKIRRALVSETDRAQASS